MGAVQAHQSGARPGPAARIVAGAGCAKVWDALTGRMAAGRLPDTAPLLELSCATRPRRVSFAHPAAVAERRVDSVRWAMLSEAQATLYDQRGAVAGRIWAGIGHRRGLSPAERERVARKLGEAIAAELCAPGCGA